MESFIKQTSRCFVVIFVKISRTEALCNICGQLLQGKYGYFAEDSCNVKEENVVISSHLMTDTYFTCFTWIKVPHLRLQI